MVDDVYPRDLDQRQAVCFRRIHLEHCDLCLLAGIDQLRLVSENVFEVEVVGGHFLFEKISILCWLVPVVIRGILCSVNTIVCG